MVLRAKIHADSAPGAHISCGPEAQGAPHTLKGAGMTDLQAHLPMEKTINDVTKNVTWIKEQVLTIGRAQIIAMSLGSHRKQKLLTL